MSNEKNSGDRIRATVGNVGSRSQVAVGKDISQKQSYGAAAQLTPAEMAQLHSMFDDLRAKVEQEAPPEEKEKALERVDELKEAVTAKQPDLTTMQYVKNWFGKHLPALAGSVVSVIVHPLVGKLVEAGGEAMQAAFRNHFGGAKSE